jgi:hypothetical protein
MQRYEKRSCLIITLSIHPDLKGLSLRPSEIETIALNSNLLDGINKLLSEITCVNWDHVKDHVRT